MSLRAYLQNTGIYHKYRSLPHNKSFSGKILKDTEEDVLYDVLGGHQDPSDSNTDYHVDQICSLILKRNRRLTEVLSHMRGTHMEKQLDMHYMKKIV